MFVEILKTSVRHDGTLDCICEWNVYDIVCPIYGHNIGVN